MGGARRFYDFPQMLSYDMFGNTIRGGFKEHFESIFPYWNDGQMEFKDLEITAVSPDFAYSTMIQHTWGTAGGVPFDTAFRRTGIARKSPRDGKWRWVHEHLSFPVDMKTQKADFTASLAPTKGFKLK
jgi:ketosteroid isomerase-like protein